MKNAICRTKAVLSAETLLKPVGLGPLSKELARVKWGEHRAQEEWGLWLSFFGS